MAIAAIVTLSQWRDEHSRPACEEAARSDHPRPLSPSVAASFAPSFAASFAPSVAASFAEASEPPEAMVGRKASEPRKATEGRPAVETVPLSGLKVPSSRRGAGLYIFGVI